MKFASLPSVRLLLEVLMENQSEEMQCVVDLFYKHKTRHCAIEARRACPVCISFLLEIWPKQGLTFISSQFKPEKPEEGGSVGAGGRG